jgi:DNA-binding SARP family transcriptional activator/TolB-like protein/Flp pilus assembly protein TadD
MIRLRTLGSLDLRDSDGQELRGILSQPKRAALLAYLALAAPRAYHRRDTLLALFWPEYDAEHARNALSQAVHFLRRALGAEIVVSRNGDELGVERAHLWCDVVEFEEALDAGRGAHAVDLYRGDLLEGFHVFAAPEFERWLAGERKRLADRYVDAVEALASERESRGDLAGAVTWWRRLAARDLYSSRLSLRLMRAMAAAGDPAAAVQHARLHEALLREDLGVAPDPQLTQFVRQLQAPAQSQPVALPETVAPSVAPAEVSPRASAGAGRARFARGHRRAAVVAAVLILVLAAGARAVVLRNGDRGTSPSLIRSIGVLPFESFAGDSAQRAFVDGMHDALITELARFPDLTVISRTSMMRYRGTTKPLPEIAKELNVDGIVEGTLFWEPGRFRMNAQLVYASDRHAWAKSYRRDLRDVLVLQGELAGAIAREIRVASSPLLRGRQAETGPSESVPDELYLKELYLRGRHAEISRSLTGLMAAKEAYRRAVERDSTFALGYAGLSAAYGLLADNDYAPVRPFLDSARVMARRAVALDSTLSETRTALAVTLGGDRDFEGAEREFKRALQLNPSDARAHYWYSVLLVALGRGEEALREANRAEELDPFAPRGVTAMQRYARYLINGTRPHRDLPARERGGPVLRLEPGEPFAIGSVALGLAEEGQCTEARTELARAQRLAPGNNSRMQGLAGAVHLECGDRARALAIAEEMKRRPDSHDHGHRIAMLLAPLGETDSAIVWLGRNQWTLGQFSGLSADYRLDAVRSDPRYAQLLRDLGLRKS